MVVTALLILFIHHTKSILNTKDRHNYKWHKNMTKHIYKSGIYVTFNYKQAEQIA